MIFDLKRFLGILVKVSFSMLLLILWIDTLARVTYIFIDMINSIPISSIELVIELAKIAFLLSIVIFFLFKEE